MRQFLLRVIVAVGCVCVIHSNISCATSQPPHKKVLFIMAPLLLGGTEVAFVNMMKQLPITADEVDVCLLKKGGPLYHYLRSDVSRVTLQEARKKQYDVVVAYAPWINPSLWMHSIAAKKRVQWLHTDFATMRWIPAVLMPQYRKRYAKKIDQFVCVSTGAKKNFCRRYPSYAGRTCVIQNIIDAETLRSRAEEPITDMPVHPNVPTIVSIGRLSIEKGFDRAIRAAKLLKDAGIDFRWYIIGEGIERAALQKSIRRKGLQAEVTLLGARKNPYPYLKRADLFVSTAFSEGFSLVIAEAKILRKPILAITFTDLRHQITDGINGLIVQNHDAALFKGLRYLLLQPEVRASFSEALQRFEFDNSESLLRIQELFDKK